MQTIADQTKLNTIKSWLQGFAIEGCIVEVGVYQGGSLCQLAASKRPCFGFDTFEGMPPLEIPIDAHKRGDFLTTFEEAQKNCSAFPNIKLIKGLFPATLSSEVQSVVLAHVDVDLYSSTINAITALWPRLVTGGRMYLDDAFVPSCRGATKALIQFCYLHDLVPNVEGAMHSFYLEKQ